ncbi:mannosyl-oligosaccharide alpha-1,2-mannosidase, partial [Nowakowskiella sp. JEL0078]
MNAQKKRMKQLDHKRAVDSLIDERRRIVQHELDLENERHQKEQELEMYRQEVIEQERQRLLREHASKLIGYFPK